MSEFELTHQGLELPFGIPPREQDDSQVVEDPVVAARQMLARRTLARQYLLPFIKYFNSKYMAGWVHKEICRALEKFSDDVANKRSPRLIIEVPPRHGKSEIASRNFPAWHLGRYPNHEIIQTSYAASLATGFSKKVRDLIATQDYNAVFPDVFVDANSKASDTWQLSEYDAVYTAAGVGGPITGKGAHIGIIDDPVKNREEADSETVRQSIKDWYGSTFYTRLAPGGGVLVIMTRWHEDDLVGWLLREHAHENWVRIRFPAVAEVDEKYRKIGEPLHEDRYPLDSLKKIEASVGPRDWLALYQQAPTGAEGDYFKKEDFQFYEPFAHPPLDELVIYSAWDFAIGKNEGNDFTVGVVAGVDRDKNLWILDMRRGRWDTLEIIEQMIEVHKKWGPVQYGFEHGQIKLAIMPVLQLRLEAEGIYDFFYDEKNKLIAKSDKPARARPLQGMMKLKKVIFPRREDEAWMPDLIGEMLTFPSGVHDDMVDAMAWLGQMLQMFYTADLHDVPKKKMGWREKLELGIIGERVRGSSAMSA